MDFKWTKWIAGGVGAAVFLIALLLGVASESYQQWEEYVEVKMMFSDNWRHREPVAGMLALGGILVGGAIGFAVDTARAKQWHERVEEDPDTMWRDVEW